MDSTKIKPSKTKMLLKIINRYGMIFLKDTGYVYDIKLTEDIIAYIYKHVKCLDD